MFVETFLVAGTLCKTQEGATSQAATEISGDKAQYFLRLRTKSGRLTLHGNSLKSKSFFSAKWKQANRNLKKKIKKKTLTGNSFNQKIFRVGLFWVLLYLGCIKFSLPPIITSMVYENVCRFLAGLKIRRFYTTYPRQLVQWNQEVSLIPLYLPLGVAVILSRLVNTVNWTGCIYWFIHSLGGSTAVHRFQRCESNGARLSTGC